MLGLSVILATLFQGKLPTDRLLIFKILTALFMTFGMQKDNRFIFLRGISEADNLKWFLKDVKDRIWLPT